VESQKRTSAQILAKFLAAPRSISRGLTHGSRTTRLVVDLVLVDEVWQHSTMYNVNASGIRSTYILSRVLKGTAGMGPCKEMLGPQEQSWKVHTVNGPGRDELRMVWLQLYNGDPEKQRQLHRCTAGDSQFGGLFALLITEQRGLQVDARMCLLACFIPMPCP